MDNSFTCPVCKTKFSRNFRDEKKYGATLSLFEFCKKNKDTVELPCSHKVEIEKILPKSKKKKDDVFSWTTTASVVTAPQGGYVFYYSDRDNISEPILVRE